MQIGDRIKSLRKEYNLTQKELSEKLGLTPKMISFYENSERIPPIDIVLKLVTIFNVSSDYLLGLTDINYMNMSDSGTTNPLSDMPDGTAMLLSSYKELTPKNRRSLLYFAFSLLEQQNYIKK